MKIRSLYSVDGFCFGGSPEALSQSGSPLRETVNRLGERELHIGQAIYRFVAGGFVEVSFPLPSIIEINGELVEGNALHTHLEQKDPAFREASGFAIAPNLGLAMDMEHDDHWITAFVAGRWDGIK